MFNYNGINLTIPPEVYPPREDTILLLDNIRPRGRVLEIGTGSGILAISLARKGHEVVATDVNPNAVHAARENARANGVAGKVNVVRADLLRGIRGPFDTVIFNPPYLPSRPLGELRGLGELGFPGALDRLATGPSFGELGSRTPNRSMELGPEEQASTQDDEAKDDPKTAPGQDMDQPEEEENEGPDDWLSRSWKGGKGGVEVLNRFMGELQECLSTGGRGYIVVSSLTDFRLPPRSGLDFRVIAEQGLDFERIYVLEVFRRPVERP